MPGLQSLAGFANRSIAFALCCGLFSTPMNADDRVWPEIRLTAPGVDNWQTGRIGDSSFDALAGDISGMFDFNKGRLAPPLILDPSTGEVVDE